MTKEPADATARTRDYFPETRASLVARLKRWDDQESWRDFLKLYGRLIHTVALQAGLTEPEAEDAVQETIIAVARTMPSFKYDPSVCSFKSWLRHLARKRIADQLRKRLPVSVVSGEPAEATPRTARMERVADPRSLDLNAVWDIEWQRNVFEAAVKRVKDQTAVEQYQMFDLYALKNWPLKKVSAALGVSAAQVYLAKHRVMRLIKQEVKRLEKEGV
jgi:RNA polymerase sigma factor (sigma-70 family)